MTKTKKQLAREGSDGNESRHGSREANMAAKLRTEFERIAVQQLQQEALVGQQNESGELLGGEYTLSKSAIKKTREATRENCRQGGTV